MSFPRRFPDGLTLPHTADRLSSSQRFRAIYAIARYCLDRGDSPEQIRSDFLAMARKAKPHLGPYAHETEAAVIQRALDAALADWLAERRAFPGTVGSFAHKLRWWAYGVRAEEKVPPGAGTEETGLDRA
jgi:hypothetical protein